MRETGSKPFRKRISKIDFLKPGHDLEKRKPGFTGDLPRQQARRLRGAG